MDKIKQVDEKIIEYVHRQLDYSQYDSTLIRDNTNCYAHAIGATYAYLERYRLGAISKCKPINEKFFSENEMKRLFLEDMKVLKLGVDEIEIKAKEECLCKIDNMRLEEKQHLILLFAVYMGNGQLWDFHFWRYDSKGFSEKRKMCKPVFIDYPNRSWTQSMKLIGLFRITR